MSLIDDLKYTFRQPDNTLKQLIIINVLVYLVFLIIGTPLGWMGYGWVERIVLYYLSLPSEPMDFLVKPWTLITYFFTHEGFFHILFNMLNLYWFGMILTEYLGSRKLLSLYVLGGIAGGLLYMLMYNIMPAFTERNISGLLIGASASVLAIVVAAATLLPNYTLNLLIIGPVKIKWIALALVLMSWALADDSGGNAGGNIAHLGGALIGWVFIKQLQRGTDLGRPVLAVTDFFGNLFTRKPKLKVSHRRTGSSARANGSTATSRPGTPDQSEIDRILDKISSSGYESLSKEEKQKLFQASQKD
ncbi:rhomboid family protein [Pontibacter akesuensis]|uniref:Membrane associated serine protease, rhomboid family n=1 Tax=Pontibacter akesuensis TaxID=388950 RepID=A0A1I7K1M3_9BACT|nr:rhomboid family intramembrane serine protease [Pontibacter akesuensis]GHA75765.1 rhomboid family intramembrane serine protease [Pontibacter akesuensis]SFU91353.1 Membrane associated serine protease, rhomboid family [Pontibacter akesuensis]